MTTIERFFYFIDNQGLKHTAIEKELGVSNGYLQKMLSRKASIGSEIIEKIVLKFLNLNVEWLITGSGEMLKSSSEVIPAKKPEKKQEQVPPSNMKLVDKDCLDDLMNRLEKQSEEIGRLKTLLEESKANPTTKKSVSTVSYSNAK